MKVRVELIREGPSKKIYIKSPKDAVKQLSEYSKRDREHLLCIYLNTKNRILGIEVVSIGILNSSICHPREVFKGAILASAKSIILAHNHPSGDPEPSDDDIALTKRIENAGRIIGIELLDHIIIGDGSYISLRERGLVGSNADLESKSYIYKNT